MLIARMTDRFYSVKTDRIMADGLRQQDNGMVLDADARELRSHESRGFLRTGGRLRIKLGPRSFAAVSAMAIGDVIEL